MQVKILSNRRLTLMTHKAGFERQFWVGHGILCSSLLCRHEANIALILVRDAGSSVATSH